MGMFDYVRSSYPLGEAFTGPLQTKDIEPMLGGSMAHYWISPAGELFEMDYRKTQNLEPDTSRAFFPYKWVPNGNHGKVSPVRITRSVSVYPEGYTGNWEDWPEATLFFVDGVITSVYRSHRAL
jgi:hypothetical protein